MFSGNSFGRSIDESPLTDNPYIIEWEDDGAPTPPPSGSVLLLSTGDRFLLSTGDQLELAG